MTIDEVIEHRRKQAKAMWLNCKNKYEFRMVEEEKQIIEWLEELKELRTTNAELHDEIQSAIAMQDSLVEESYAKGFNDGCAKFSIGQDYEDGIDDFVRLYIDTISSSIAYALNHTDEEYQVDIKLIHRLAEELKGGVKNDD